MCSCMCVCVRARACVCARARAYFEHQVACVMNSKSHCDWRFDDCLSFALIRTLSLDRALTFNRQICPRERAIRDASPSTSLHNRPERKEKLFIHVMRGAKKGVGRGWGGGGIGERWPPLSPCSPLPLHRPLKYFSPASSDNVRWVALIVVCSLLTMTHATCLCRRRRSWQGLLCTLPF